jgi:hypothetical protein
VCVGGGGRRGVGPHGKMGARLLGRWSRGVATGAEPRGGIGARL